MRDHNNENFNNPWPGHGRPFVGETVRLTGGTLTAERVQGCFVYGRYTRDSGETVHNHYTIPARDYSKPGPYAVDSLASWVTDEQYTGE